MSDDSINMDALRKMFVENITTICNGIADAVTHTQSAAYEEIRELKGDFRRLQDEVQSVYQKIMGEDIDRSGRDSGDSVDPIITEVSRALNIMVDRFAVDKMLAKSRGNEMKEISRLVDPSETGCGMYHAGALLQRVSDTLARLREEAKK